MSYHVLDQDGHRVCALTQVGDDWSVRCAVVDFLKEMSANKSYRSSSRGLAVVFNRYAKNGRHGVTQEMFHEADKKDAIWEFIKGDLRVLCFMVGSDVFLTNGYIKKSQKADPTEVNRAINAKKLYLAK